MRKLLTSLLVALALTILTASSALGHVHGITPLRCVAPHAGANAAQGGPITGLIPLGVGNAEASDGVVAIFGLAFDTPACPVE